MNNKSLRDYINLVEERTDRFGKTYDPTVNPHAAADAARAATPQPTATPSDQVAAMSPAQRARWKTKNPEMARMGLDQYNRYVDKNAPTTTTSASAKSSTTRTKKTATPKTSKPSTPTAGATAGQAAKPAQPNQYGVELNAGDVKQRQQFLVNLGYNIKVDGIWGPETEKAYQSAFPSAGQQPAATTSNTGTPDAYTQGKLDKTGQSADMAAAVGMPNPYVKTQPTGAPAQPASGSNFDASGKIIGMPPKVTSTAAPTGRDASGKPYTDWTGNNPQPGAKSLGESDLDRIKNLVNYKN